MQMNQESKQVKHDPFPFPDFKATQKLLGNVSRATINRLVQKGILEAYKLGGKLYFKRSQVIEAIEAGKMEKAA